ncbi:Uncharacterised protein [Candidatus Gugararchaeum adminiculabundum]|nr:Uncharacterised protein [Candidatus Gugararchaeum adminiculabundum]
MTEAILIAKDTIKKHFGSERNFRKVRNQVAERVCAMRDMQPMDSVFPGHALDVLRKKETDQKQVFQNWFGKYTENMGEGSTGFEEKVSLEIIKTTFAADSSWRQALLSAASVNAPKKAAKIVLASGIGLLLAVRFGLPALYESVVDMFKSLNAFWKIGLGAGGLFGVFGAWASLAVHFDEVYNGKKMRNLATQLINKIIDLAEKQPVPGKQKEERLVDFLRKYEDAGEAFSELKSRMRDSESAKETARLLVDFDLESRDAELIAFKRELVELLGETFKLAFGDGKKSEDETDDRMREYRLHVHTIDGTTGMVFSGLKPAGASEEMKKFNEIKDWLDLAAGRIGIFIKYRGEGDWLPEDVTGEMQKYNSFFALFIEEMKMLESELTTQKDDGKPLMNKAIFDVGLEEFNGRLNEMQKLVSSLSSVAAEPKN